LDMLQVFKGLKLSDGADFNADVTAILYRWAGVDTVDPSSRGPVVNAQQLGFLEKFFGEAFVNLFGSPNPIGHEGQQETNAWNIIFSQAKAYLLVQGPLASLFPHVGYNFDTDSLVGSADLPSAISAIAQAAPS